MKLNTYRHTLLQAFIFIIYFTSVISLAYAQTSDPNLSIIYNNNLITISAKNADLKNVLLELADKTNIIVRVPNSVKEQITIKLSGNSLDEALSRILKDMNYAIIYSGVKNNRTVISEVIVYNKSESSKISNQSTSREQNNNGRIKKPIENNSLSRIKLYENRLKTLNEKLSEGNASSKVEERYKKQIRVYEDEIEKLKKKL